MYHYLHKIFTLSVFDRVQECIYNIYKVSFIPDRLCGLVVRVLGYRFGGPGFDSQALQDFPTKKKKKENK
jgi:hypothetical protein